MSGVKSAKDARKLASRTFRDRGAVVTERNRQWTTWAFPDQRTVTLMCRHADTQHYETNPTESDGVILSRLVSQHHERANQSEFSYTGKWLCFCVPHKGTA